MELWQAFVVGIITALLPSMLVLLYFLSYSVDASSPYLD
jgi:hypothetical protein